MFSRQALKNAGTLNFVPKAQNLLVPLRFTEARARLTGKHFLTDTSQSVRYRVSSVRRPVKYFAIADSIGILGGKADEYSNVLDKSICAGSGSH